MKKILPYTKYQKVWNDVYSKKFMTMWQPPEAVVQFSARFLKKRLTLNTYKKLFPAKKILDVGCGNGAVPIFFAKQGYAAYGIDLSKPAINIAREYAQEEKVSINIICGDASNLPYNDNLFDCVVSYGVLDHMEPDDGRRVLGEIYRVVRRGGLFFLTLADKGSRKFGKGKKVAHNTYRLGGDWYEAGAVQHYFDKKEIKEWLKSKFEIVDVRLVCQQKLDLEFTPEEWDWRWHITTKKI